MQLPNGDPTEYDKAYAPSATGSYDGESAEQLRVLLGHFKDKRVVDLSMLELDDYGDGNAVDQAIKFHFDDGSCVVLLPQDGDSDARYCTLEILDTAEFDAHASVTPPTKPWMLGNSAP